MNRSGYLDGKELRGALTRYGINLSTASAAEMVRRYDANPDGKLDLPRVQELIRDLEAQGYRDSNAPPSRGTPAVLRRGAAADRAGRAAAAAAARRTDGVLRHHHEFARAAAAADGAVRGAALHDVLHPPVYSGTDGERYLAPPMGAGGRDEAASLEGLRTSSTSSSERSATRSPAAMVAPAWSATPTSSRTRWARSRRRRSCATCRATWMAMVALLGVLLLVWSNCRGLRRLCSCFEGQPGRAPPAAAPLALLHLRGRPQHDRYHDLEDGRGGGYSSHSTVALVALRSLRRRPTFPPIPPPPIPPTRGGAWGSAGTVGPTAGACRAGGRGRRARTGAVDRETQWNVSLGGRVRGTRMCVMPMGGGAVAPLFVCAQRR